MPRIYPPRRVKVNFRDDLEQVAVVDRFAEDEVMGRSEMLRLLIAEAIAARLRKVKARDE